MARSRKEIEQAMAELQAELDAEGDDVELLVEHPKTKAVGRLRGAHAQSFLDSILGTEPAGAGKGDDKGDGKGDDKGDGDPGDGDPGDAPPARQSVWGRK